MDPSKRFATLVMAAGIIVLLIAIALGEGMGDAVFSHTSKVGEFETTPTITPIPQGTTAPYGPDWKASQALAAAPDPGFPDPRIPPKPLPTALPPATPTPAPRWTPNPKVPIWDQTPPPSAAVSPSPAPSASATAQASPPPHPAASGAAMAASPQP